MAFGPAMVRMMTAGPVWEALGRSLTRWSSNGHAKALSDNEIRGRLDFNQNAR